VDVKPRKSARQARAKATVDAIVEATTQVLLKEGYDRFTTARAAERAGVSVGSLYQYFPNKAALASAVIDRCCKNFLVDFENSLSARRRGTLADCIRAIVDLTLVSHHLTPELHRIVLDLAPRIGVADRVEMVSRATANVIESMLRKHAGEIAPEIDLVTAATIIETVLEALAHRVKLARPARAPDDALAKEAIRLITNYLAASTNREIERQPPRKEKAAIDSRPSSCSATRQRPNSASRIPSRSR
jgi:AcrR family transcriptional regulator